MPAGRGGHGGPVRRRFGELLAVDAVEAEDGVGVQGFRVQRERDGECCRGHAGKSLITVLVVGSIGWVGNQQVEEMKQLR